MASKAAIAKYKKVQKLVQKYAQKRLGLLSEGDYLGLSKLPRSSSKVRLKRRCEITGRPRGFVRRFKMSRIAVRQFALAGLLPGVKKLSW